MQRLSSKKRLFLHFFLFSPAAESIKNGGRPENQFLFSIETTCLFGTTLSPKYLFLLYSFFLINITSYSVIYLVFYQYLSLLILYYFLDIHYYHILSNIIPYSIISISFIQYIYYIYRYPIKKFCCTLP